jgi:hypothetical protein
MKSKIVHWLAIILILETGLLHIMTAQAEYEEAAYMGYLFAVNFFGAVIAAFAIYRRQFWGWMLGLLIAGGSIAGFVWSRTLGMPGMDVEEWFSPYGIVSLSVEGLFILLIVLRPWKISTDIPATHIHKALRLTQQVISIALVVSIGVFTQQWDIAVTKELGHHVGSLKQVCSTPAISFDELEQKYGLQVSLAATSMMGSIVDVRIKVTDPDKAHMLLQDQAALLVNQEALILSPHMHSHTGSRLRKGKIFVVFFPTQRMITTGSQVSLVFGSVRVEPVTVR